MTSSSNAENKKANGYKPWPKDGKPAGLGSDILPALRRAFLFAYDLKRKNVGRSIPWNGLDIGEEEKACCHRPKEKLSADQLKYSEDEQGRDALEELLVLAVQLGIEQGRRMDRDSTVRRLAIMSAGLKLHSLIDGVINDLTTTMKGKPK